MKGNENYQLSEEIRKKTYYVPNADHQAWNYFRDGFQRCTWYSDLKDDAKIQLMFVYPNISSRVVARVVRCNHHTRIFAGYNYIVEFSGDVYDVVN